MTLQVKNYADGYYQSKTFYQKITDKHFVILGYIDGEQPHTKPRKPNRIKIIE